MTAFRPLVAIAAVAFSLAFVMTPAASADIISIQAVQSCNLIGLDPTPGSAVGGVHCDVGNTPFKLSLVLGGALPLFVGNSQTPSWNVVNDTGSPLTSLTLFYSGALASNANIDMQVNGTTLFAACSETTSTNVTFTDLSCGSGDTAPFPVPLPLKMVWSGGTGVAANGTFNIGTASFAHAGADAGCISGTANCKAVPEPGTLPLLVTGLLGVAAITRRGRARNDG